MPSNFNDSFFWDVTVRSDRPHTWKSHAVKGTLVYEVLGLLDKLATNNPHRFVFIGLPALLKRCSKGKRDDGVLYSMQHLKAVLAELRARHIVSPYFKTWEGRKGFIVEPHSAGAGRSLLVGKVCKLYAYRDDRPMDETSVWRPQDGKTKGRPRADQGQTTGRLEGRPTGRFGQIVGQTEGQTDELAQVYQNAELTEALCQKWLADGDETVSPNRRSAVETDESAASALAVAPTKQEQKQGPLQSQKQERGQGVSLSRPTDSKATPTPAAMMTDKVKTATIVPDVIPASASPTIVVERTKTIGEHFERGVSYETLTDGRITDDDMMNFDEPHLTTCMCDAVAERKDQPFCGLVTLASLMGVVMSQMKKRHSKNCPPMWLPVMKSMRAKAEVVRSTELNPECRKMAARNLVPGAFHIAAGMERCEDEIWRTAADREHFGFTVRDTYETQSKTYALWKKAQA